MLILILYTISVAYCFYQLDYMIDRSLDVFSEKYPALKMDGMKHNKGLSIYIKMLLVSSIPVLNIALGYFAGVSADDISTKVVDKICTEHGDEIEEMVRESKKECEKYYDNPFPDCPPCGHRINGDCEYKSTCFVAVSDDDECYCGIPSQYTPESLCEENIYED